MAGQLHDRVALITGGARGNGRGIAEGFAREGARILLADINEQGAQQTASEIQAQHGVETQGMAVDVGDPAQAEAMVAQAVERWGRVDILVNNAGILPQTPVLEMTPDFWHACLRVNLDGALYCAQAAARQMVKQGDGGAIINITSMASVIATPNSAAYCASKGGLHMLTRAMAVDLAQYGIRVNAIQPAIVLTDMNRHLFENDAPRRERALVRVPMGRMGDPADLAGAAIFLASDAAAYVTGTSLPVDGGYMAR